MNSFNSNLILLVESDVAYAIQLKQTLEEKGAIVISAYTVEEAKKALNRADFDLLISAHNFSDGNVRDLFAWCKDSLSTLPILSAIGNCSQLEKKQLEKLGVQNFFQKSDSLKLFDDISRSLFDFDKFKKDYLEAKHEKGVSYELKVGNKRISVKALEIMEKGVFLSFETPFSFGHSATLELKSADRIEVTPITVVGVLQGEFSEGQFFKVNDDYLTKWRQLLTELDRKQNEVSEFLRKASGK